MTAKGQGALFVNNKKTSEKSPDYQGDFKLTKELLDELCSAYDHGLDKVQLAGWKKQGKNGTYLSLSVSPPYRKQEEQRPAARPQPQDDIPF